MDQIEVALAQGRSTADLEVAMGPASTAALSRFMELLDLADEFCREERLLSLARSPEQRPLPAVVPRRVRASGGGQAAAGLVGGLGPVEQRVVSARS